MNWAHIHLMLNHIPLIGVGFLILLFVIALLRKSNELINVSLIFVVIVALWAIPAYLTGEPAEEIVENLPGISENLIKSHEESAETAFIFIEIVGALALITLFVRRFYQTLGSRLTIIVLIGLLIGGGLIAWTANLGGKINHPDIRSNAILQNSDSQQSHEKEDE